MATSRMRSAALRRGAGCSEITGGTASMTRCGILIFGEARANTALGRSSRIFCSAST